MENHGIASSFSENMDNEIRVLHNNPHDYTLLDRACKELLPSNFEQSEAAEAANLLNNLAEPRVGNNTYVFVLIGNHLDADPKNAVIKGLATVLYFGDSNTGAGLYTVTDPQYRKQGLGRQLLFARQQAMRDLPEAGGNLTNCFVYAHDPDDAESVKGDPFDARSRIKAFHKLGMMKVNIPHFYSPDTDESGQPIHWPYMLLVMPNHPGEKAHTTKKAIRENIVDYYKYYGVEDPYRSSDFSEMMRELYSLKDEDLLVPLIADETQPKPVKRDKPTFD